MHRAKRLLLLRQQKETLISEHMAQLIALVTWFGEHDVSAMAPVHMGFVGILLESRFYSILLRNDELPAALTPRNSRYNSDKEGFQVTQKVR